MISLFFTAFAKDCISPTASVSAQGNAVTSNVPTKQRATNFAVCSSFHLQVSSKHMKKLEINPYESDIENILKDVLSCEEPLLCEALSDPDEIHEPKVVGKPQPDGTIVPGLLDDMKL